MYLVIKSENGRRSAYIMDTEDAALEKMKALASGNFTKVICINMEKEKERLCGNCLK